MNLIKKISMAVALASATMSMLTGCSAIKDDEPTPCPRGLAIRFVYDYNLERANAFHSQVDCLTLHIYDSEGRFVRTLTENSGVLANEDYMMRVDDLPEGDYLLVAYGGAECDRASFAHTEIPSPGTAFSSLGMRLNAECLEPGNPKGRLHDHFYGTARATVVEQPELKTVTVKMMKNTNHFRILLQHLSYEPLDGNDYDFEIRDDNTLFDCNNNLVDAGQVVYTPWAKGQVATGNAEVAGDGSRATIVEVKMAYADLSTSRLMTMRSPKLIVRHKPTDTEVINIPLNNYLLTLRGDHFDWAGEQEFLDRKSDWPMFFFLDDEHTWHKSYIRVEDWIVRVNEING